MKFYPAVLTLSFCFFVQTSCSGQRTNRTANESSIKQTTMNNGETVTKTSEELIAEFSANSESATEKYTGKTLQITGEIFERASPKDNVPETNASYIVFGNPKNGRVYILCYFDDAVSFNLRKGDTITVIGNFVRFENLKDIMKGVFLEKSKIKTRN